MTGPNRLALFQPIVRLRTGRIEGFEALLQRERSGSVAGPGILQDETLAGDMLSLAAKAVSDWRRKAPDLFVQVNITAHDLTRPALPQQIRDVRRQFGLPPGVLRLEMTEHVPIASMEEALAALDAIKAAGAGLVIDDFGSGYSSLAWLHDLPIDALKIDADLTSKLGSARGNVILAAAAQLGHALDLTITAEGVERVEQGEQLRALGFDFVQGYAFGRPQTAEIAGAELSR